MREGMERQCFLFFKGMVFQARTVTVGTISPKAPKRRIEMTSSVVTCFAPLFFELRMYSGHHGEPQPERGTVGPGDKPASAVPLDVNFGSSHTFLARRSPFLLSRIEAL